MSNWKRKIEPQPNWERSECGKLWTRTTDNVALSNEVTPEMSRRGTYRSLDEVLQILKPYMSDVKSARSLNSKLPIDPHNSARDRFPHARAGISEPLLGGYGSTGPLSNFLEFLAERSDVQLSRKLTKRDSVIWSVVPHRIAYYLIQHTNLTPEQAITIRASVPSGDPLLPESYVDVLNGMPVEWAIMRDSIKLESREPV